MSNREEISLAAGDGEKVRLFFTPVGVTDDKLRGCRAVVVDVLRASTSIVQALSNGANGVIPAASVDLASELASQLPRDDVLLCGERDAQLIDGFNLGNSPAEYRREVVKEKQLIFASTNGSKAIVKAASADKVYLCGFVNLNAVIDALLADKSTFPLIVLCSGNYNRFSLEDSVCGGELIKRLSERLEINLNMNDGARASVMLVKEFGNDILKMLNESDHGRYLTKIGMSSDLPLCAADSTYSVVPVLRDGRLVRL
ncbi:2-phosphosulfolactate phosphatase [bacterium]|nr:2-phosphosulfolactate phosphatase [bacterium]